MVAGLLDEEAELLEGDGGGDGLLSGLRGKAHRQVLLVSQQIGARLGGEGGQSDGAPQRTSLVAWKQKECSE